MSRPNIVVAAIRPWNREMFRSWKPRGYRKVLIRRKEDLTLRRLRKLAPRYIFFPHWSWLIPSEVYENFECVVFHMTDLPFGRGGSPMQNLIARGIYKTKISAIRVDGGLDTGPVYLKEPFDISRGSAEELFRQLSRICFSMMTRVVGGGLVPRAQRGRATYFRRRTPDMSRVPARLTARQVYDFIRMLDAPEYPPAFIEQGDVRIELRSARIKGREVSADAKIISRS